MRKSALFLFGLVAASLVALGLVVLCSASQPNAVRLHHGNAFAFFLRQLAYVAVGIPVAAIVAKVDYRIWKNHRVLTWLFYGAVFLSLLAVFPPIGHKVNGSYRWIPLGPVNLQPSEFAKLAIVIVVAFWMDRIGWKSERFWVGFVAPLLLIGGFAAPILAETDLGSAVVVGGAGLLMMLLGGTRWIYFIGGAVIVVGGVLGVMLTNANRMRRLAPWLRGVLPPDALNWLGMEQVAPAAVKKLSEMDSAQYQVYNSLVAIKNGGLWGVGLGKSMQKQYYLPEAHTDFVMAVGAEELGVIFSIAVVMSFSSSAWQRRSQRQLRRSSLQDLSARDASVRCWRMSAGPSAARRSAVSTSMTTPESDWAIESCSSTARRVRSLTRRVSDTRSISAW